MVLGLAIALVVLVILGMGALVAYDVATLPRREWHLALKQWQQLTGAVLGLLGAAGVFVLGTEIQADQERQRAVETQHAIGTGLAIEVERLAQGLRAGQYMAASLTFGSPDDARHCAVFMSELRRYLPTETPVYTAMLAQISQFGDRNITWFVRFYGIYGDLLRALAQGADTNCTATTAAADVGYVASLIGGGLQFYEAIAGLYDIVPVASDGQIAERLGTPPSATPSAPAQPATPTTP